jgi:hypothetical protein
LPGENAEFTVMLGAVVYIVASITTSASFNGKRSPAQFKGSFQSESTSPSQFWAIEMEALETKKINKKSLFKTNSLISNFQNT